MQIARASVALVRIAFVACLFAVPTSAFAQDGEITGGIKGGLNISSADWADDGDIGLTDSRAGWVIGGFVHYAVDDVFGIQPEVLLSQQGFTDVDSSDKVTLRYLQVPILGTARLGTSTARVFVVGGPALGVRLSASSREEGSATSMDVSEFVTTTDFSLVMGGGFERNRYSVEARYWHGLRDVGSEADSGFILKNRMFSILFGYRFGE